MRRATPAPVRSLRMCGVPVLSLKYKRRPRPLPISSVWVETAPAAAPISSNGNRFLRHRHPCVRSTARWMTSATSSTRPVPTGQAQGCNALSRQLDDGTRCGAGSPPAPAGRCVSRDLPHGACRLLVGACRPAGRGDLCDDGTFRPRPVSRFGQTA